MSRLARCLAALSVDDNEDECVSFSVAVSTMHLTETIEYDSHRGQQFPFCSLQGAPHQSSDLNCYLPVTSNKRLQLTFKISGLKTNYKLASAVGENVQIHLDDSQPEIKKKLPLEDLNAGNASSSRPYTLYTQQTHCAAGSDTRGDSHRCTLPLHLAHRWEKRSTTTTTAAAALLVCCQPTKIDAGPCSINSKIRQIFWRTKQYVTLDIEKADLGHIHLPPVDASFQTPLAV